MILLGVCGAHKPEGIWVVLSRVCTLYYYLHFLVILPVLGKLETAAAAARQHQPAGARRRGRRTAAGRRDSQADGEGVMRAVRSLLAALLLGGLAAGCLTAAPALAQEAPTPPHAEWSLEGPFGTFDLAAAQRGFQVYSEVCSNCHSMNQLHYRDLAGIGLTPEQIQAIAAAVTVPLGLDDQGNPKDGPATPGSQFRSPFANEQAARAADERGAAAGPVGDRQRARGRRRLRLCASLTGSPSRPTGFTMQGGMNYNEYFPGHQIAMPQPLHDGQVTYADGTPNTIAQMSHDVVTFLAWAANPEMVERKQIGCAGGPVPGGDDRPDLRGEAQGLGRRGALSQRMTGHAPATDCSQPRHRHRRRLRPV